MPEANKPQHRHLSRRAHNALLTAHIMIFVGSLGDSAGFPAVATSAAVLLELISSKGAAKSQRLMQAMMNMVKFDIRELKQAARGK